MALPLGSKAPDFALPSQTGELLRLSELTRDRVVVLFFYPKDDTPGCTVESCAFRDSYEAFVDAGAEVVGISKDNVDSHRAFADKLGLPFKILADTDQRVRKLYRVKDTIPFLLPGRETFVIDRQRTVRHCFTSQAAASTHVTEAKRIVVQLAQERAPSARAAHDGGGVDGPSR
jgi:peroxiredoxin Q/BCP